MSRAPRKTDLTQLDVFRNHNAGAAIVFLHGFSATSSAWGDFPSFIVQHHELANWSVFSVRYATSRTIGVPFWTADPGIIGLAINLRTVLETSPLNAFESIVLVAHSMGGLVAQYAVLNPGLEKRINQLFLFGTPSLGLRKASLFGWVKRQARDMQVGSRFIKQLRLQWETRYKNRRPFAVTAIAGASDAFVSADSVFGPFLESEIKVIPGDHVSMVMPSSNKDIVVNVLADGLLGHGPLQNAADSAAIAVERGRFRELVAQYLPAKEPLDHGVAVNVALALDNLDRRDEAITLLESLPDRSSDALGTLAGRYKRKWLTDGGAENWRRSRELYGEALTDAIAAADDSQAMYHAINLAFLEAMQTPNGSHVSKICKGHATAALAFADNAMPNHWNAATRGEAALILGDLKTAMQEYTTAKIRSSSPRERMSMYGQALLLASHIFGEDGIRAISSTFGLVDP